GVDTHYFPVDWVSWNDAVEFCKKLSQKEGKTYRLPTEAEWEYACRAGTATRFSFGHDLNGWKANFDGNSLNVAHSPGPHSGRTVPVGSYNPNALGLYDMHGNESEWCSDYYRSDYYGNSPTD